MAVNPTWFTAPRVGLEPTSPNQQSLYNKELTENINPVFATSLAKIVQKYPELEQIITAWPELPEHVIQSILKLVQDAAGR
jgi:hypothetical protein